MGETLGVGAGFEDGVVEGEPVDDRCTQPGVGEGLRPSGEGFVRGNRDGAVLFSLGEDLKEQFGRVSDGLCKGLRIQLKDCENHGHGIGS